MSIKADLVIADMGEVERRIEMIAGRFSNISLKLLATDVALAVDDVLQSEGADSLSGAQWEPFAASTLKRHPRRRGGMLLQDTGLLANVQTFTGADYFGVRSPAPYAGYHVTGTRNMPKRDFLDVDVPAMLSTIEAELADEIVG